MVHSLDPHSYLYSKKDLELIARYNQDRWGEVCLQTEYQDGLPRIKYIPPSAKGYRAGLRVGDRIVMIDGEQLAPNDRVQFRRLIRGPEGSRTTLGILRDNKPSPHRDSGRA
ncbi:S41 family peptidase [Herbaspirillum seropedicae]|uniref:S41 family peptidase n=1 Tax=Herbaspirillum seropedicae TaxID=964 RepID=UPI003D967C35